MKQAQKIASVLSLLLVTALNTACSKEDKTYISYAATPGAGNNSQTAPNVAKVPAGVWLDGVNDIQFYNTSEGLVFQSDDSVAKAVSPGGFNGAGLGSKSFVGFHQFDGLLTSDITGLSIGARLDRGVSFFYLNLLVDCNGNNIWEPGTDTIVTVDSTALADFGLGNYFSQIEIDPTQPIFKSVGGLCGLPLHSGIVGAPLSALPAGAKLLNADTGDGGMPRNTKMASVLLIMGDSGSRVSRQITLKSMKLNTTTFQFSE